LGTPLERYEYLRIPIAIIPDEIIEQYNLRALVRDGAVYVEIRKGMYGLPQAGKLANDLLEKRLAPHGYYQCRHTPGLWRHKWRPVLFSLVVDDFGVKYVGKRHADHLVAALKDNYQISEDWEGKLYCGITLEWDYKNRTVDLSMPGYIEAALHKYQHLKPQRKQHAPHRWERPIYGAKQQMAKPEDDSPLLPPEKITLIQQIVGTLLYYARAVDSNLLVALGTIAANQAKATEATMEDVRQLLNYCATYPNAKLRFAASCMILRMHSDASYLSVSRARSRAGGHFFLGTNNYKNAKENNGAILTISQIIKNVMASAAEAECGALFINTKEAVALRNTLEEMGHPQPATPVQVDNTTADGIMNGKLLQKRSKAMDMRFYWVQDRVRQKQFHVFWAPGTANLADYFTKHHAPVHHKNMRPVFTHVANTMVVSWASEPGPASARVC
jgi:hypothetical protein